MSKDKYKFMHAVVSPRWKARNGMSKKEYLEIFESQGNRCAICGSFPESKALAVDHCHTSGKNRGLLCMHCNTGLGHFRDNVDSLIAAARYLIKHGASGSARADTQRLASPE